MNKLECPNCGIETDDVYEHELCGHEVCANCGERHIEDCEWISKQN